MKTSHKILLGVLIVIALALLARYVVFADQFEEWGAGLERIGEWEQDYRANNPDATDEEVDAAFKSDMAQISLWMERYKAENPGATDADAEAAFNAAWGN